MKHCPEKGCTHYSYSDNFCPKHGKKLVDYPKCNKCGKESLYYDGYFCTNCGGKIPNIQEDKQ